MNQEHRIANQVSAQTKLTNRPVPTPVTRADYNILRQQIHDLSDDRLRLWEVIRKQERRIKALETILEGGSTEVAKEGRADA